ncbi:MAG: chorismate mutase, partial [Deltaproteobacteria bacterium]|nr:chorismate mutase [Deltaproteobacteria bacterium]
MPNVKSVRSRIDEIDTQILELLTHRMRMARDVGNEKASLARQAGKKKATVLVPEREEQIYRRVRRLADQHRLPWPLIQSIFTEIVSLCRATQGQVTAHVLGPAGTHSDWAARARFGEAVNVEYHDSIPRAFKAAEQAVANGDVNSVAVVPIENSLEGTIPATADALLTTSLKLVGEGFYRVRHALLSKARSAKEVKTVYSHPMGLAQCARWLQENLPSARLVEVSSTAEAARHATGAPKNVGAIASPYLAGNGLNLVASDIQDSLDNTTRFGILGAAVPGASGDDKTSLVFSLPNKSGSLADALDVFS